jgi:prepilin-type N-terminal cleavage/methylation domain-containing protein
VLVTPVTERSFTYTQELQNMKTQNEKGFTLIELMIVVVIIGILAAIAIPNFIAMTDRAKEAGVKSNGHTFQLAAEDHAVQNDGTYAASAVTLEPLLPGAGASFKNPFTQGVGAGVAWEDRVSPVSIPTSSLPGIVSYADSSSNWYNVKMNGKSGALALVLGTE